MEKSHPIQAYFPDPYYAVAVPLGLLVLGVSAITSLIALVMIRSEAAKAAAPQTATVAVTKKED